jgi:hypothetical protein
MIKHTWVLICVKEESIKKITKSNNVETRPTDININISLILCAEKNIFTNINDS